MKEVVVGAELHESGLEFFGVDEINALLQEGHRVVKVEPGEVIMEEMPGETSGEEETYAFMGFDIKITLEESAS